MQPTDAASRESARRLLSGDVVDAARSLLGCTLVRRLGSGGELRAVIVETEAYHANERGCHAFHGITNRTRVMLGEAGLLYVYISYGIHHCMNIVCGSTGEACAVLLRAAALEPGGAMPADSDHKLLCGPGKLCRGLQVDKRHYGLSVLDGQHDPAYASAAAERSDAGSLVLLPGKQTPAGEIGVSTRIGFSFADALPWRFYLRGHPAVSARPR